MKKELLFSLTKKDFIVETFRAGGKGGQNQNKRDSGVRIKHPASGAVGESREERSQLANKKNAFNRLTKTTKFIAWHKKMCAQLINKKSIEDIVEELMAPEYLKIETKDEQGRWKENKEITGVKI